MPSSRSCTVSPPLLPISVRIANHPDLNTPQKRQPPALRPVALLHALQTLPAIRRLLSTREQQDAHELFLVLAEAVSDEAVKVAAEVATSRGFGEILTLQGYLFGKDQAKEKVVVEVGKLGQDGGKGARAKKRGLAMPWEGLMARRRVCKRCGWCESIRMDTLGGMELAIPQSVCLPRNFWNKG
jgi:ubiquitin carboxyl-terminal hydrolase 1